MFDNLCKSWPRGSQHCINRLKNKQTSYRVLNTVLIKVLYERSGSWPQKCYGDGYSTGWLRHFIATRRYEFFNFRNAEARSAIKCRVGRLQGQQLSLSSESIRCWKWLRKQWLLQAPSLNSLCEYPLFHVRERRMKTNRLQSGYGPLILGFTSFKAVLESAPSSWIWWVQLSCKRPFLMQDKVVAYAEVWSFTGNN